MSYLKSIDLTCWPINCRFVNASFMYSWVTPEFERVFSNWVLNLSVHCLTYHQVDVSFMIVIVFYEDLNDIFMRYFSPEFNFIINSFLLLIWYNVTKICVTIYLHSHVLPSKNRFLHYLPLYFNVLHSLDPCLSIFDFSKCPMSDVISDCEINWRLSFKASLLNQHLVPCMLFNFNGEMMIDKIHWNLPAVYLRIIRRIWFFYWPFANVTKLTHFYVIKILYNLNQIIQLFI